MLSLGGIVVSRSLRVGGYWMDEAIAQYIRGARELIIGSRIAEAIKLRARLGAAARRRDDLRRARAAPRHRAADGGAARHRRDPRGAAPAPARDPAGDHGDARGNAAGACLRCRQAPIVLAGGGTLLRGLADLIESETEIATTMLESALTCVATGSGLALEHFDWLAGSATGKRRAC